MQEFVNGCMLRRRQRQVVGLELLALQALSIHRGPFSPSLDILHDLVGGGHRWTKCIGKEKVAWSPISDNTARPEQS